MNQMNQTTDVKAQHFEFSVLEPFPSKKLKGIYVKFSYRIMRGPAALTCRCSDGQLPISSFDCLDFMWFLIVVMIL